MSWGGKINRKIIKIVKWKNLKSSKGWGWLLPKSNELQKCWKSWQKSKLESDFEKSEKDRIVNSDIIADVHQYCFSCAAINIKNKLQKRIWPVKIKPIFYKLYILANFPLVSLYLCAILYPLASYCIHIYFYIKS